MLAYDYWRSMQYSFFVAQTFFLKLYSIQVYFLAKRKCNLFFLCQIRCTPSSLLSGSICILIRDHVEFSSTITLPFLSESASILVPLRIFPVLFMGRSCRSHFFV